MYNMHRIYKKHFKVKVVCEHCYDREFVSGECNLCGGKGVRNKTFEKWEVRSKTYLIDRIDRDSSTGELRYWEDASSFFEESAKLIHFNKKDAEKECKRRNKEINKFIF